MQLTEDRGGLEVGKKMVNLVLDLSAQWGRLYGSVKMSQNIRINLLGAGLNDFD